MASVWIVTFRKRNTFPFLGKVDRAKRETDEVVSIATLRMIQYLSPFLSADFLRLNLWRKKSWLTQRKYQKRNKGHRGLESMAPDVRSPRAAAIACGRYPPLT